MDDEVDTLGRWMSHFLAERIAAAENEEEPKSRKRLQLECCDLILQLWEHRTALPYRARQLGGLTRILDAIVDLRTNESPYCGAALGNAETDDNHWLVFAKEIEAEAKSLVRLAIFQALAESVLPVEAEKAEKFREFLSEKEAKIVEELQRLIIGSGKNTPIWQIDLKIETDVEKRTLQALASIEARSERIVESCRKLREVATAKKPN